MKENRNRSMEEENPSIKLSIKRLDIIYVKHRS